jgi:uncharacterized membrane protein
MIQLKTKTKFFLLVIIMLLTFIHPVMGAPRTLYEYEGEGWIIEYEFSTFQGEPGDKITFAIEIFTKKDNYDLRVYVKSEYLTIEKKYEESNLYWAEVAQGETRVEDLKITIPDRATLGEIYKLTVKVTSHSNPRLANVRLSIDAPEYVFESNRNPEYMFDLMIQEYPVLRLVSPSTNFPADEIGEFTLIIENIGNGDARNVQYEISTPETIELLSSSSGTIDLIPSNSQSEITVQIIPLESSMHQSKIIISAVNHNTVEYQFQIDSQNWSTAFYIIFLLLIIVIFLFIGLLR